MSLRALVVCGLLLSCNLQAQEPVSPRQLVDAGDLRVGVVVDTPPPYFLRAPLVIAVEVATPRWFSRGSRVRDFRIPGAVVQPVSSFADKLTERTFGRTWTAQRWRYRVYPQAPGALTLPALRVFVSVNHEDNRVVEGEVLTRAQTLSVIQPPGTEQLDQWVATGALTLEEQWQGTREEYRVGDALTRLRTLSADDVPAMMLPPSPSQPDVDGLSLYQAPAVLDDRQNRGDLRGERREQLVITAQRPGTYELPGRELYWYDTQSGTLKLETLPPQRFTVVGAAAIETEAPWWSNLSSQALLKTAGLVLLLGMLFAATRVKRRPLPPALRRRALQWRLRFGYWRALRRGDARTALVLLHRAASAEARSPLSERVAGSTEAAAALRQLLAAGYAPGGSPLPAPAAARTLWQLSVTSENTPAQGGGLALNPR